jgi:predicted AAA+ superfamily ATPase
MKVVLLGSSRVLLEKGLSDSMMGRFEEIRMTHWSYPEMRDAFGISLEQYLYFGGYPGAVFLIEDEAMGAIY